MPQEYKELFMKRCKQPLDKPLRFAKDESIFHSGNSFLWLNTPEGKRFWSKVEKEEYPPIPGTQPKKEYWRRDDYRCAPFLRSKASGLDYAIKQYQDNVLVIMGDVRTYEEVAREFTLPDGAELYKVVDS